ncbi:MAG: DNA methyltransferase, partial [Thiohalocapsa sp.]
GKVVTSEDIPAATQLFTPNWIVKYMVQNSLGAQWLATYPDSPLKARMDYYIEPAEQTPEVQAQLDAINPASLDPEALTLMDPACGSGHILVEAYELFKAIYLERGYRLREIPKLILEKNLYGLDIDPRAAQLAGFALMMKAREDDRRVLERGVGLNVMALEESGTLSSEQVGKLGSEEGIAGAVDELVELFRHARTFGSLIQVPEGLAAKLPALSKPSETTSQYLFISCALRSLQMLVRKAELLTAQYDAVVANPPYMGIKNYAAELKRFIEKNYKAGKRDTYAAFVLRGAEFLDVGSRLSMITLPNWMFHAQLASFRDFLRTDMAPCSLLENGRGVFGSDFGSCAFVYRKGADPNYRGRFQMLFDQRGAVQANQEIQVRFHERKLFERSHSDLDAVPGRPLAYWLSERLLMAFSRLRPLSRLAVAKHGMSTSDNDTYLRSWHESISRVSGSAFRLGRLLPPPV